METGPGAPRPGLAANLARTWKVLRLVRFFPGHRYVFVRAASGLARALLGRPRPPRAAEVSLGSACTLACAHCYATDLAAPRLPLETVRTTLDALARAGCLSVVLVGGEPTLRPDLDAVVAAARARRLVPFVITNGMHLDRERLARLRASGLFGVLVSLVGTGERHDRFVGAEGAWERALGALVAARDLGLWAAINTTATRTSVRSGDFGRLVDLAEHLRVPLKFNYPALLGRWSGRWEELLGDLERAVVHAALARPHVTNDMVSAWDPHVCPAGRDALYVSDAGEVTPCAYIPISFGNVREEPLAAIVARMRASPPFARRHGVCLAGEDRSFVARYVSPAFGAATVPLGWRDHPRRDELAPPP